MYANCSGRHDVRQENANVLQHLQSDHRSGASTKILAFLKPIVLLLFKYHDKSSPVNFEKYDIMPYNTEIVS